MAEDKVLRLIVLLVVFIIFWVIGLKEHQGVQPNSSDTISLPRFLRFLFGVSGSQKFCSLRGIIGQLFIFSVAVIYSLNILGYISNKELAKYFLVDSLMLSFLWLLLSIIFKSKKPL